MAAETDEAGAASETAEEAAAATGERGIMRFFDRQYMLDSGVELPGQWGVAAFVSTTESKLPIEDLKFGFSEDEPLQSSPFVTMDDLDNEIVNSGIILDYWVLPMLDVYAILGQSDGEMNTNVNAFASTTPLGFNFTGTTYAAGATLAMGYKQALLMLDYNYMELDTDVYEERIPASNRTVRLGWNFGRKAWWPAAAWVSCIHTEFEGSFDLEQIVGKDVDPDTVPPGAEKVLLSFEVEEYETWAVGAQWDLGRDIVLVSELGFDTVTSLTLALNYRWN
jgi:hypothetical protein